VLDPYNGSGTTAVVSKKYNLNYIGIDISENYINMTKKRIKDNETSLTDVIKKEQYN